MNRKAKRNKFKKLQKEYEEVIAWKRRYDFSQRFTRASVKQIQTLSTMVFDDEFLNGKTVLSVEQIKELQKDRVIYNIANALKANFEQFFHVSATELGMVFDLSVVRMR